MQPTMKDLADLADAICKDLSAVTAPIDTRKLRDRFRAEADRAVPVHALEAAAAVGCEDAERALYDIGRTA